MKEKQVILVKKNDELLKYLYDLNILPKKKMKSLLVHGNILVNGKITTKYNEQVKNNDVITIQPGKMVSYKKGKILPIIYEDNEFIVIDKPTHLLSVATNNEKDKTAYKMVLEHVRAENKNAKVYVLHRLDKDTSGVLIFTKNEKIKKLLQDNWNELVTLREYIALVEGTLTKKSGVLKNYLTENKIGSVVVTDKNHGKLAITHYEVIDEKKDKTKVKIKLDTGRKNQIRVQFSNIGNPIVGDKKYGSNVRNKRLCLHASKLTFIHPITKKVYNFSAVIPKELESRLK